MSPPDVQKNHPPATRRSESSALEVLFAFTKLGLSSFGGPVAHLGYFRAEFVERRKWLDDKSYSDLVALCQFLPGPASSQVGIALGLGRAGWPGALAAWLGFTLPSAIALILFSFGVASWSWLAESGAVHGLKVVAVAVVAQAVWGMSKALCPDRLRAGIAVGAALLVLVGHSAVGQLGAIALGGLIAWRALSLEHLPALQHREYGVSKRLGAALLAVFGLLLGVLPMLAALTGASGLAAGSAFYQAGALVFGGGHVVLPLLQASVVTPGWVSTDTFLAGYGAAQAVPGPLFTFAAFLGAALPPRWGAGWVGWPCLPPFFCRPSCWWLARCPTGRRCANAIACNGRWPGSMRRSLACLAQRFTIRYGPAPSIIKLTLALRCWPTVCLFSGKCRR